MNEDFSQIAWKFRHIRFVDSSGNFTKVQKKLNSYSEVLSFLREQDYLDAYYSVASFVNPHKIGAKTKESETNDLFLGMDLFFDIDFDEFSFKENIERARVETLKILNFGERKGWKLRYACFSGSKGFHVCFLDPFNYASEKPFCREAEAVLKRKEVVEEVKNEGIKFDEKITSDSRRIVRIPGTYNSKTGYLCTILSKSDLEKPTKVLLKSIERNKYWELRSRFISAMTKFHRILIIPLRGFLPKPRSNYSFLASVTSNAGKNHVIYLELKERNNVVKIFEQKGLPCVIIATPAHKKYVFSPCVVELSVLKKIARAIDSPSVSTLSKYKHTIIPFQFLDKNMKVVGVPKVICSSITQTNKQISTSHSNLFPEFSSLKSNNVDFELNFVLLEHKE